MDDGSRAYRSLSEAAAGQASAEAKHPALELHGITKQFGSLTALNNVSLALKRGTIHALLGENGAGKTTLMRIAFGLIAPDTGQIVRDGRNVRLPSPAAAIAARIGMVHQQFSLIPAMTVADNVALGGKGRYSFEQVVRKIKEIGDATGLVLNPLVKVSDLTSPERQKLEIVRAFAHNAEILILDEPTAVLTEKDIGELFTQLRRFVDTGGSVILITHKLRDAMQHADEITVLRHGEVALHALMHGVTEEALTTAMLGSAPRESSTRTARSINSTIVARLSSSSSGYTQDVEVHAGEILGVAALEGRAGKLLRMLAARTKPPLVELTAQDSVGFVPENRQEDAIVPEFSLTENLALRNAGDRAGLIDWVHLRDATRRVIQQFDVRASGPEAAARSLSGGNQQRFVLGRELIDHPSLLVLENPTQGLDVNAASAVHERIKAASETGTGIIFYSSDLDELADLSDRVIVLGGRDVMPSLPDRDEIGRILLGVETGEHPVG